MVLDLPDYHEFVISISTPPSPEIGNPKKYEGSVAIAGVPVTLAVYDDLGRNSGDGYIVNDGPGDLQIDISFDGAIYCLNVTLKEDEVLELAGLNVHTIIVDATENGTEYRALVI